jgi:ATP-dependent RNA helicase MSS116
MSSIYNKKESKSALQVILFIVMFLFNAPAAKSFYQQSIKRHAFLRVTSSSSSPATAAAPLSSLALSASMKSSNADTKRPRGKDREQELATLANNLKVHPSQLRKVLQQKRSQIADDNSEKAKYIDWLLVSTESIKTVQTSPDNKKPKQQAQPKAKSSQPSFLTTDTFADRKDLHPASKRALAEVLKLSSMTEIQLKTFEAASSGKDVLGRARTGTGKTLAFLLPAIERILQQPPTETQNQAVGILIISPTRELAMQIGDQAEKLTKFHSHISVQVIFGGTNINRDKTQFQRQLPTVLVATPGRLIDHLESTTVGKNKFGRDIMSQTQIVVLDETDRLLDMGFRREIGKIFSYLPRKDKRQTLLFSATIPQELKGIMAENMKPDFIEVDCINDADADSTTSAQIQQSHIVVPTMDRYISSVVEVVQLAMEQDPNAKIVVFFPTARMVAFFAEFFNEELNIPVVELHSKKSQSYRNRASEQFRQAKSKIILFTSDVSARGVDYPGVTHVIQFGMPDTREQYIHRLGRTGRAGSDGKGWLVLGPFESLFLQELKGLNVPRNDDLLRLLNDPIDMEINDLLTSATDNIRENRKRQASARGAYQAFLGFYLGKMKRINLRNKEDLVSHANLMSSQMGLPEVPSLTKTLIAKMGLKGVEGISATIEAPAGPHAVKGRNHFNGKRSPRQR